MEATEQKKYQGSVQEIRLEYEGRRRDLWWRGEASDGRQGEKPRGLTIRQTGPQDGGQRRNCIAMSFKRIPSQMADHTKGEYYSGQWE